MRKLPRAMALATACVMGAPLAAASEKTLLEWAQPMREVHNRFTGTPGTLALFGDSITVSLAFWAPLAGEPKAQPPDMAEALKRVKAHQRAECWREWLGPDFGVNLKGSPTGIVVEQPKERLARVDYGSAEMAGAGLGDPVRLHPRCQKMYDLLEASRGGNDLTRLQAYFADPGFEINVGEATIDMMVFDTTSRSAYLSRGTSYRLSWRRFVFGGLK